MEPLEKFRDSIPQEIYSRISGRIKELLPPQSLAVEAGLFKGKNILVSSPTASGKTLVGEMAALNAIFNKKKVIYVAPMKALLSEKYEDFTNDYPGFRAAISTGDLTESDIQLNDYDIIFVSTEKLDSILRSSAKNIVNVGCIIYDEIHLLGDPERGPALEFVITLNKRLYPKAQIIGLSATIGNSDEIAAWLGSELVKTDFRPVKLARKIYFDGELINGKKEAIKNVDDPLLNIVMELIKNKKQALVFSQTKKTAVSNAKSISESVEKRLSDEDKKILRKVSSEILHSLDAPTTQCRELSDLVQKGVAFHHAGLVHKQRKAIEQAFKDGWIKFIVSTPTLALGVNLPANTVVITSVYRYGAMRMELLSSMEVAQMCGRAGRPKYDKEGTAIILARTEKELSLIRDKYIDGEIEPVESNINKDSSLRRYVLALICFEPRVSLKDLNAFFDSTFYATRDFAFSYKVGEILDFLVEKGFVKKEAGFAYPTEIGRLINRLYLDPYTGLLFSNFLEKMKKGMKYSDFNTLHLMFCAQEFRFIRISQSEEAKYERESFSLDVQFDQALVPYERYIAAIKIAKAVYEWISEKKEAFIEEEYGILPGEFYGLLENSKWLLFALRELARFYGVKPSDFSRLSIRVMHGIKEELLPLISMPGIGRVRARRLYSNGLKSESEVKSASRERLVALLGSAVGNNLYTYFHKDDMQPTLKGMI
ncbi:MAG: DEAD/DEAH box helicase [Candidatus Parvarchaeota archaeon]|nr:DEAD/DEAH box helicase [Candidatus Parvarchaeota archaeon]